MPPQINATLTAIRTSTAALGDRDDWDQAAGVEPAGADAVKWEGEAPAYYSERVQRTAGDGTVNVVPVRVLYIDSTVARLAGLDTDDVLVWTDVHGLERRATAAVVSVRELVGIPANLQTARVDLAP